MTPFQFGALVQEKIAAGNAFGPRQISRDPIIQTPDGPGRLLSQRTLPKADATARNWQGAAGAPQASHPSFQTGAPAASPAPMAPPMRPLTNQPDLPMKGVPSQNAGQPPMAYVPHRQPERPPLPARQQAPAAAPATTQKPKSPYDDPSYDSYPRDYNPINAALNAARPARKFLHDSGSVQ